MRTITIELDGGALVADIYDAAVPSDQPPVLLIHGWGGSGRYWQSTVERLRDRFTLVVPDLPGVGRALPVRRPFDMPAQAAALEALLARLRIERAHVVGHSMGGGIALLLAARRPELIDRLALTAISLFRSERERAFFRRITEVAGVMMRLRANWMADLPFLTRQFAARFFYSLPADPSVLRDGFLDYLQMDRATALASARSAASPAIEAAARHVAAPTLLVAARQDQVMPPENVPFTLAAIAGSRVRWIERCGHLPMIEHPDEYAAILREFLLSPMAVLQSIELAAR
jgi:pimeloyl-ACP methyl ester carboxylesterase